MILCVSHVSHFRCHIFKTEPSFTPIDNSEQKPLLSPYQNTHTEKQKSPQCNQISQKDTDYTEDNTLLKFSYSDYEASESYIDYKPSEFFAIHPPDYPVAVALPTLPSSLSFPSFSCVHTQPCQCLESNGDLDYDPKPKLHNGNHGPISHNGGVLNGGIAQKGLQQGDSTLPCRRRGVETVLPCGKQSLDSKSEPSPCKGQDLGFANTKSWNPTLPCSGQDLGFENSGFGGKSDLLNYSECEKYNKEFPSGCDRYNKDFSSGCDNYNKQPSGCESYSKQFSGCDSYSKQPPHSQPSPCCLHLEASPAQCWAGTRDSGEVCGNLDTSLPGPYCPGGPGARHRRLSCPSHQGDGNKWAWMKIAPKVSSPEKARPQGTDMHHISE